VACLRPHLRPIGELRYCYRNIMFAYVDKLDPAGRLIKVAVTRHEGHTLPWRGTP
jgi:hypothetical protein